MKKIHSIFIIVLMSFLTLVAGFELYGIILNYGNPFASLFCGVLFFSSSLIFISFYILIKHKNEKNIFFFISLYVFKFIILLPSIGFW